MARGSAMERSFTMMFFFLQKGSGRAMRRMTMSCVRGGAASVRALLSIPEVREEVRAAAS